MKPSPAGLEPRPTYLPPSEGGVSSDRDSARPLARHRRWLVPVPYLPARGRRAPLKGPPSRAPRVRRRGAPAATARPRQQPLGRTRTRAAGHGGGSRRETREHGNTGTRFLLFLIS